MIPWTPLKYQLDAVQFIIDKKRCALWLDPGLRKTSISLAAIKFLLKNRAITKILIIAPLRVCELVWVAEIEKWADFNELTYTVLHGSKKEAALYHDTSIYIINYDGLAWLFSRQQYAPKFDFVIFDEISKLKHANTQRFKLVKKIIPSIPYRLGLTGSPASNSLMGLFSQTYVLDDGKIFGKYITHFRARYFYKEDHAFDYKLLPLAEKMIHNAVQPLIMCLKAEDYIDMPTLVSHKISIKLPPKADKIYKEMEKHFIAEIEGGTVTAANAATKTMKLRQITSGEIYSSAEDAIFNGSQELYAIHDEKIEALKDLVEELQGKPLLVLYEFIHERDRLIKVFGKNTPYLGGGITKKRAVEIEQQWNAGELPILLGQPQSMGYGLNLQESGNHICFFTTTWNYELYDQVIRRIYRSGCEEEHVFVYHIVAKNTIDEAVLYSLKHRKSGQDRLLDAITWFIHERNT